MPSVASGSRTPAVVVGGGVARQLSQPKTSRGRPALALARGQATAARSLSLGRSSSAANRRGVVRMGGPGGAPVVAPKVQDAGDPFGLLLQQRIVFLGSEVNDFTADAVVSQLLLLDAQDPTKDIKLFINSPGGSVTAGAWKWEVGARATGPAAEE
eukprot:scaffold3892_cov331-Prasinococcus_capsulatus_cf.AAC.5